jgi:hypothetical protein
MQVNQEIPRKRSLYLIRTPEAKTDARDHLSAAHDTSSRSRCRIGEAHGVTVRSNSGGGSDGAGGRRVTRVWRCGGGLAPSMVLTPLPPLTTWKKCQGAADRRTVQSWSDYYTTVSARAGPRNVSNAPPHGAGRLRARVLHGFHRWFSAHGRTAKSASRALAPILPPFNGCSTATCWRSRH